MNLIHRAAASTAVLMLAFILYACTDSSTTLTNPDGQQPSQPYSETIRPGFSANDFLSDSSFSTLIVEVDYMEGYAPTQRSLDSLHSFLTNRLNKDHIIINDPTSIPAKGRTAYTASLVRDLEKQYRDLRTEGDSDTLTAYMIILDGKYESGSVLGVAYYNTSTAYFGKTIDDHSGGATQPPQWKLEGTVMQHEFGHLFGLVNIEGSGSEMQNDHQDEEYGHHCDNDKCLMYWAVQTTDFVANLIGSSIPELDQNCIIDLQANGGK